ncbi:aprataxin and PNK-like factor isoform X2 [Bicyclus anynana]|uniref:Aprataxin and PNK-like factor isoform X2 n=1 Tax=Bicyclus anynana TaxID=110368 RepID=A0ABM3LRX5_BICAN|nr:aprataxin and PNK-like factor isoform X2 [Bicyclus anynana]
MTIKLVRTDAEDPCKIQLPLGDHVIGRGKLLECDDKRISRQHGKLNVTEDSLTITALHLNPCFYIKKGSTDTEILKQNSTTSLFNGDRFGLLPDTFWYEVLFCSGLEAPKSCESEKNTEEYCVENNDTSDETHCDKTKTCDFNSDDGFDNEINNLQSPSLIAPNNNDPTPQGLNSDATIKSVTDKSTESSAIDQNKHEPDEQTDPNSQNDPNVPTDPNLQNDPNAPNDPAVSPNNVNPTKRSHSPDNSDVKKIKTEPVEVKTESSDDVKPGPSLKQDQGVQTANGANAATNNAPLGRERCMYGANCYRKNPGHQAQFSHPRDADWGPGERGVCPYGAACARTDPRHWRDHDHPPGKLPPPRPGMQVVHRHGNIFFIKAHCVNFHDDHFRVEDSDGDSVDLDYEF